MGATSNCVFITGGTGYVGRRVIPLLLQRGHTVHALLRPGSEAKIPLGCEVVLRNALDAASYADRVQPADTLMQLVGVRHPSPSKAAEFQQIDLPSGLAAVSAAQKAGVQHSIHVSVAQPAPVTKAHIEVRAKCEEATRSSGVNATILRPWYVLGPGHRWPYLLLPLYALLEQLPATREGAQRLGLVTLEQMVTASVEAVENPSSGVRICGVSEILRFRTRPAQAAPILA
jgi:uncharacterized protein YbjT (DUF2867 family)